MPIPRTFEQPLSSEEQEKFKKKLAEEAEELQREKDALEEDARFKNQSVGYRKAHHFQTEKTGIVRKDHLGNRAHSSPQK